MKVEKLENGLTLCIEHNASVPLVTLDVWVRVGSGQEPEELAGISHFLEHMLFKGTQQLAVGEYDRLVEEVGGYLNAATSMDYTHYYVTIPSRHFDTILGHFADVMQNSILDPAEVEKERQVVLEEISRKADNPFGALFDATVPRVFESGSYKHPVIGDKESVQRITRDQLRDHYERFYVPENMSLCVVGDLDVAAVRQKVETAFAGFNRPLRPWRDVDPPSIYAPPQDRTLPNPWNEAYFIMAFPSPKADTAAKAALYDLGESLLGGGRRSRLVNALQEKSALVSNIGLHCMANRQAAPVLVYGTCTAEKLPAVRDAILGELQKLYAEGPSDKEMQRVRRMMANSHLFALETNAGRARIAGYSQTLLHNLDLIHAYADLLREIPTEEVVGFLKEYLAPEKASFFTAYRNEG